MAAISVDIDTVRRQYIRCKQALELMRNTSSKINRTYAKAGQSWKDDRYRQLGGIVNTCCKELDQAAKQIEQCMRGFDQAIAALDEYESVNMGSAGASVNVVNTSENEALGHFNEDGSLRGNENYEANGYYYQTDGHGRITSCAGDLRLEQGIRNTAAQRCVGGDDREDYDDGGHLIATRFGGSGELDNLVPMSQDINRRSGEWYDLEESWAEELSRGNEVNVQIYIEYSEGSNRPSGFDVMYTVTDTETGESTPYHEYIENNHA